MYEPKYRLTNSILISIGKIEAAKETIESAPLLPMWERRFRESAMVRAAHHGTHIEGNQLAFEEARQVLLSQDLHAARSRDVQEVLNYRAVLDYIGEEWGDGKKEMNEAMLKKLHKLVVFKILPDDLSGHFRTKKVVIKDSSTGEITFTPPDPADIPFMITEFAKWLQQAERSEVHPVLKAGIAHHEFVRIHPYLDGNGRVARALSTLILYVEQYDIRRFFSLEEQYDNDPLSYYHSLQKANEGDLTPWLEYFCQKLTEELELLKGKIKRLSMDSKIKDKLGGKQVFLNERQAKIMEFMQEAGYVQNQAFDTMFPEYSEDTILRDLNDLIEKGIVKKIGKTKGAKYLLSKG
ncbi:MAG: Fic family protein [Candidatus Roizmanbacteria bacterium]|nr:Fic family protein [Candidatus Roizmanbacteria bacterium]